MTDESKELIDAAEAGCRAVREFLAYTGTDAAEQRALKKRAVAGQKAMSAYVRAQERAARASQTRRGTAGSGES